VIALVLLYQLLVVFDLLLLLLQPDLVGSHEFFTLNLDWPTLERGESKSCHTPLVYLGLSFP
jgi:hypothetical protein